MKKINSILKGAGVTAVLALSMTTAAFAHDASAAKEDSHAYTNAEACTTMDPATGTLTTSASQTTDGAYPTSGIAADCNSVEGSDTAQLTATAHVLASCSLDSVNAVTGDVSATDGAVAGDPVSAFSFPTQTSNNGSGVKSDTMNVSVTCNSGWTLQAEVDGNFTSTTATTDKLASSFGVDNGVGDGGQVTFTAAATPLLLDTKTSSDTASRDFNFYSANDTNADAGDYTGTFTLTVTAV